MKHRTKLSGEQQSAEARETRGQAGLEFDGADELLRYDAAQTVVPPQVEQRLQAAAGESAPPRPRPWWKSLLGR